MYVGDASKNAHYASIHYFCPIWAETEMERQIFVQLVKIKSNKNNFRSFRVAVYGRTDERKERLISIGTLQGENGTYKKPYTGVTFVYPSIHYQRFNRWTKPLPVERFRFSAFWSVMRPSLHNSIHGFSSVSHKPCHISFKFRIKDFHRTLWRLCRFSGIPVHNKDINGQFRVYLINSSQMLLEATYEASKFQAYWYDIWYIC